MAEIALSRTVKEIEAYLCFSIFWQKFENTKWPPFLGREKFFENCHDYIAQIPCGSKISTKSLLSRMVSFAFDAPKISNDLPQDVRSATSVASFRKKLKTYLFAKAYSP